MSKPDNFTSVTVRYADWSWSCDWLQDVKFYSAGIFALDLKVIFFRKYDGFFSLPKKCAENYPEKVILKLCCV